MDHSLWYTDKPDHDLSRTWKLLEIYCKTKDHYKLILSYLASQKWISLGVPIQYRFSKASWRRKLTVVLFYSLKTYSCVFYIWLRMSNHFSKKRITFDRNLWWYISFKVLNKGWIWTSGLLWFYWYICLVGLASYFDYKCTDIWRIGNVFHQRNWDEVLRKYKWTNNIMKIK